MTKTHARKKRLPEDPLGRNLYGTKDMLMEKVKKCSAASSGSYLCLGLVKSVVLGPDYTLNSAGWLL